MTALPELWWLPTAFAFFGVIIGAGVGYLILYLVERLRHATAERDAKTVVAEARRESDHILKEARVHARDELVRVRESFDRESQSRRQELMALEERLTMRETNLDRKIAMLDKKEQALKDKIAGLEREKDVLKGKEKDLEVVIAEKRAKLQEVAHLSQDEARRQLLLSLEADLRNETAALIRRMREEAKEKSEAQAREIIVHAIERYAADQVSSMTTSSVALPNEEMKGRIIGREGRNIRALEAATGVNILIDETPEVVVVSSFDPLRREIARVAIERLMADGRIQPGRIEEVVAEVKQEIEDEIRKAGEAAIYELGLQGVSPELMRTLGRLKYRHSFAQNVLRHSVEMAHVMGMMASELGLDPVIAKRVGLFHDIGKALDHQVEGSHAIIGADLLRRCGETPVVYNAVAAHHGEVEPESLYPLLASAADAMSASRPGARSETTEIYIKRLEKLEEIAKSFRGVEKCYAMQAGREIRVLVEPAKIDDNEALQLARNISKQIEQDLQYPGQVKVTVIRETRYVEYAR